MSNLDQPSLKQRFGGRMLTLSAAVEAGNEKQFQSELDLLMRECDDNLWSQLRKLTSDLNSALERFQLDSRLVDLAEKEVPDARHRLDHVLRMTDEAAHKTMDLVDSSVPLAGRISRHAQELGTLWTSFRQRAISPEDFRVLLDRMDEFLPASRHAAEEVRKNLAEVLMTQGYQDLSGQIIRGVIKLVDEVEATLGELVQLATGESVADKFSPAADPNDAFHASRGHGPAVPGVNHGVVVGDQQDVDALLSGLGM